MTEGVNAKATLSRARHRVHEETTGDFDFARLQKHAMQLSPPHFNAGTYVGPIEVRLAGDKGRGLFLTKDVKAGDLLLCEKAFSHAHVPENTAEGGSKTTISMNPDKNRMSVGGEANLLHEIVRKLHLNSSLAQEFNGLYHGDYSSVRETEVDGQPITDT